MHAPPEGRILIVRLSAVGDVITSLPTLASLRLQLPGARIAWAVEEASAPLLRGHPHLDDLVVLPLKSWRRELPWPLATARTLREAGTAVADLRRMRFDVVLDLQGNLKSGIVSRLTGCPRRIGYAPGRVREGNHLFMTEYVDLPVPEPPRVERSLRMLTALDLEPRYERTVLGLSGEHRAEADAAVPAGGGFVVMHPGTSAFGSFKRWPADRYGRLALSLKRERGLVTLVTCGPGEGDLARAAQDASEGAARALPPFRGGLMAMAALLERASLMVAADTGPLHLAAALGRPVVALFGPKDPSVYAPLGSPRRIVRRELPCSPCRKRSCPDPICMTRITVDDVLAASLELLAENGDRHGA